MQHFYALIEKHNTLKNKKGRKGFLIVEDRCKDNAYDLLKLATNNTVKKLWEFPQDIPLTHAKHLETVSRRNMDQFTVVKGEPERG